MCDAYVCDLYVMSACHVCHVCHVYGVCHVHVQLFISVVTHDLPHLNHHHPPLPPIHTQCVSVAKTAGSASLTSDDPLDLDEDDDIIPPGSTDSSLTRESPSGSTVSGLPPGPFLPNAGGSGGAHGVVLEGERVEGWEVGKGGGEEGGLYLLPREYLSSVDEQRV